MCGTKTQTVATQSSQATQAQNSTFGQGYTYDPNSMSMYQGLLPGMNNVLQNYMADPLKSGFFNKAFALSNNLIGQQGQTAQSNLLTSLGQRGLTANGIPALGMSMQQRIQRATSGQQAGNLTNLLLGYSQNQLKAAGMSQAFNPLVTGVQGASSSNGTSSSNSNSDSTTSTSGLGTWLPQMLSAGVGLASMFAGGGMGGGSSSGAGYGSGNNNVYAGGTGSQTSQMGVPYSPNFPSIGMAAPASYNPYLASFMR